MIIGIISADLKKERKVHGFLRTKKIWCGCCGFVGMKGACAVYLGEDACFYLGGSHKDKGISSQ